MKSEDRNRCIACGKVKPIAAFEPGRNQCRTCRRISRAERRASPGGKAVDAAYRSKPEVRAARNEAERRRYRADPAKCGGRVRTKRWRMCHARSDARRSLRSMTDPAKIARTAALIAEYDRIIARMDAELRDADRGRGRPRKPPEDRP